MIHDGFHHWYVLAIGSQLGGRSGEPPMAFFLRLPAPNGEEDSGRGGGSDEQAGVYRERWRWEINGWCSCALLVESCSQESAE